MHEEDELLDENSIEDLLDDEEIDSSISDDETNLKDPLDDDVEEEDDSEEDLLRAELEFGKDPDYEDDVDDYDPDY